MSPRPIYPASLYLDGRRVLMVADDPAATADRRARLERAGADLAWVEPADYRADMCVGAVLVIAQTDDPARNRRVAADARERGALAYAHDQPAFSDLAMPAVARRGHLSLAIATDGAAPALARRLREELDRLLTAAGPRLDALVDAMAAARGALAPAGRAAALYRMACRLRATGAIAVDDREAE